MHDWTLIHFTWNGLEMTTLISCDYCHMKLFYIHNDVSLLNIQLGDRILGYSKGWFQRFTRRNNLTYRRVTGSVTRPPLHVANNTIDVVNGFKSEIDLNSYVYTNMDEFDMPLLICLFIILGLEGVAE